MYAGVYINIQIFMIFYSNVFFRNNSKKRQSLVSRKKNDNFAKCHLLKFLRRMLNVK